MGIRFHCPNGHKLNVKTFQAGMRGVCPYCGAKFTIPGMNAQTQFEPTGELLETIWYVRPPSGGQFGPADAEVMRTWLKEGRVTPDSLVWREGWRDWAEAVTVFPKLARGRWSADDGDSSAKPAPPTPPTSDPSKLGQKDTKKSAAGKIIATIAKRRPGGRRRLRSAREVKNRQVMIVVGLSALVVALACVLAGVLIRNM